MIELPTLPSYLDSGGDPVLALGVDLFDDLVDMAEDSAYLAQERGHVTAPRLARLALWLDDHTDDPTAGLAAKWALECEENPSLVWQLTPYTEGLAARLHTAGITPART